MAYVPPIETVRAQVRNLFSELGASGDPPRETILIRHGHYCGRRFRLESWEAIWFVEEGQIKFYRSGSGLCHVLELIEEPAVVEPAPGKIVGEMPMRTLGHTEPKILEMPQRESIATSEPTEESGTSKAA